MSAAIARDDSCSLETEQVPTTESNLARQYLAVTEASGDAAALISSDSPNLEGTEHAQVPQRNTFRADHELHTEHCAQLRHPIRHQTMLPNRVTSLSGSQPSLSSTLSAFVTGAGHNHHHQQSSSSGKERLIGFVPASR